MQRLTISHTTVNKDSVNCFLHLFDVGFLGSSSFSGQCVIQILTYVQIVLEELICVRNISLHDTHRSVHEIIEDRTPSFSLVCFNRLFQPTISLL